MQTAERSIAVSKGQVCEPGHRLGVSGLHSFELFPGRGDQPTGDLPGAAFMSLSEGDLTGLDVSPLSATTNARVAASPNRGDCIHMKRLD